MPGWSTHGILCPSLHPSTYMHDHTRVICLKDGPSQSVSTFCQMVYVCLNMVMVSKGRIIVVFEGWSHVYTSTTCPIYKFMQAQSNSMYSNWGSLPNVCGYFWLLLLSFLMQCMWYSIVNEDHRLSHRDVLYKVGIQQCCIDYFNLFFSHAGCDVCMQLESRIKDLAMKISLLLNQHASVTIRTMHKY